MAEKCTGAPTLRRSSRTRRDRVYPGYEMQSPVRRHPGADGAQRSSTLRSELCSGVAVSSDRVMDLCRVHGVPVTSGCGSGRKHSRISVATLTATLLSHTCSRACLTREATKSDQRSVLGKRKARSATDVEFAVLTCAQHAAVLAFLLGCARDSTVPSKALDELHDIALRHNLRVYGHDNNGATFSFGIREVGHVFQDHHCDVNCRTLASEAYGAGVRDFATFNARRAKKSQRKRAANAVAIPCATIHPASDEDLGDAWLRVVSADEHRQIEREWLQATSSSSLATRECSFCGIGELQVQCKFISRARLDISLLEDMVAALREHYQQPEVYAFRECSIVDGAYTLCQQCYKCVSKKACKFITAPVVSYANGTWRGSLPPELQGLSWLEEQCIALARVTRCTFKLYQSETAQRFARGNVCVLPQDPSGFASALPPPLEVFHDEIAVILVASKDTRVTVESIGRTPLLIRRARVLAALDWLKCNNPLYRHISIDPSTASLLPEHGTPTLPATVTVPSSAVASDGVGYTNASADIESMSGDEIRSAIVNGCTLSDVNGVDTPYVVRKLRALNDLRSGHASFVKYPSGNVPISLSHNPRAWAAAFPTVFPWGCGMFQDVFRLERHKGFRNLDMKTHACHIFQLHDKTPQTHVTFPFAVANKMQVTQSCHEASIAIHRQWFSKLQSALRNIDQTETEAFARRLQMDKHARPETDSERAMLDAIGYVHYMQTDVVGSNAQILRARERIRALYRHAGLASIFLTVNFADAHNPITQFLAGNDIDLESTLSFLPGGNRASEGVKRAKTVADNPFASTKFFYLMLDTFLGIILGRKRDSGIGVLGKINHYFVVVENQGRGSLHGHMLLWIDGALSPEAMRTRIRKDPAFKDRVFRWLESIIKHSFPEGTHCRESPGDLPTRFAPMSRPKHPDSAGYDSERSQTIRDLLHQCGQVHDKHNDTCFKHLPASIRRFARPQDCRFGAPWQLFDKTCVDEDGKINLQRRDACVNAYNDTITYLCACNTDIKAMFTSGALSLRVMYYVTNYIAKVSMDTSMFLAVLHAVMKLLGSKATEGADGARTFLLKMSNQFVAKRELSGPQVAAMLLKRGNIVTSCEFSDVYWSALPRFAIPQFYPRPQNEDKPSEGEEDFNMASSREEATFMAVADCTDTVFLRSGNGEKDIVVSESKLVLDILYRPVELEDVCVYDQLAEWAKIKQSRKQHELNEDNQEENQEENDEVKQSRNVRSRQRVMFIQGHPQRHSHCLVRLKTPVIPTLIGVGLPRRPQHESAIGEVDKNLRDKYYATMLLLFRPWNRDPTSVLKQPDQSWASSWATFSTSPAGRKAAQMMDNQQQIYDCEDAKDTFIEDRRKRAEDLRSEYHETSPCNEDKVPDTEWNAYIASFEDAANQYAPEDSHRDLVHHPLSYLGLQAADASSVFAVMPPPKSLADVTPSLLSDLQASSAKARVKESLQNIGRSKDAMESANLQAAAEAGTSHDPCVFDTRCDEVGAAFATTLAHDIARLQAKYAEVPNSTGHRFEALMSWQKACIAIISRRTLNPRQALAFLIICEHEVNGRDRAELKLIVHGPGGAGKSALLEAVKEFYRWLRRESQIKCLAPSGVAAMNIGGSTIHHEASVPVNKLSKGLTAKAAEKLRKRWANASIAWIDEVYFIGAELFNTFDHNIRVGLQNASSHLGGLNSVCLGDLYQLEPPLQVCLFDGAFVETQHSQRANGNKSIAVVSGIASFRENDQCVVLTEVMRQRDPIFVSLINRVRTGDNSNQADDYSAIESRIIGSHVTSEDQPMTLAPPPFSAWVHDPANAAPLVTYTNIMRDHWNLRGAQAFANASGQDLHVYYSRDYTKQRGGKGARLPAAIQAACWRGDVKKAKDYSGALPLCINMPVFLIENIAVELGLANSAPGYVRQIEYEISENRRYAISVSVEFASYRDPNNPNNHLVVLGPMTADTRFKLNDDSAIYYKAVRHQVPLILAFAFTVHNSQSKSLNTAILDLASSTSQAMTYVMLSRVRHWEGLYVLRPFAMNQLFSRTSQQKRQENDRLNRMAERTEENAKDRLDWYFSSSF